MLAVASNGGDEVLKTRYGMCEFLFGSEPSGYRPATLPSHVPLYLIPPYLRPAYAAFQQLKQEMNERLRRDEARLPLVGQGCRQKRLGAAFLPPLAAD